MDNGPMIDVRRLEENDDGRGRGELRRSTSTLSSAERDTESLAMPIGRRRGTWVVACPKFWYAKAVRRSPEGRRRGRGWGQGPARGWDGLRVGILRDDRHARLGDPVRAPQL